VYPVFTEPPKGIDDPFIVIALFCSIELDIVGIADVEILLDESSPAYPPAVFLSATKAYVPRELLIPFLAVSVYAFASVSAAVKLRDVAYPDIKAPAGIVTTPVNVGDAIGAFVKIKPTIHKFGPKTV